MPRRPTLSSQSPVLVVEADQRALSATYTQHVDGWTKNASVGRLKRKDETDANIATAPSYARNRQRAHDPRRISTGRNFVWMVEASERFVASRRTPSSRAPSSFCSQELRSGNPEGDEGEYNKTHKSERRAQPLNCSNRGRVRQAYTQTRSRQECVRDLRIEQGGVENAAGSASKSAEPSESILSIWGCLGRNHKMLLWASFPRLAVPVMRLPGCQAQK